MSGNSNQEADALFATKRKKQQEEQAEQDRQAEILRKKAEMEAEINRLAEETERQRIAQEEAKQAAVKAEEEAVKAAQGAAERAAKVAEKKAQTTEKAPSTSTAAAMKEKIATVEKTEAKPFPVKMAAIIGGAAAGVILLVVILAAALSGGGTSKIFKAKLDESVIVKQANYTVNYPSAYFADDNGDGSISFEYGKKEDDDYTFILVEKVPSSFFDGGDAASICQDLLNNGMSSLAPTFDTYSSTSKDGHIVYSTSYVTGEALGGGGIKMPVAGMILYATNNQCYFASYGTKIEGKEDDLENLAVAVLNDIKQ